MPIRPQEGSEVHARHPQLDAQFATVVTLEGEDMTMGPVKAAYGSRSLIAAALATASLVACTLAAAATAAPAAQTSQGSSGAAGYFAGKRIDLIVPNQPGRGMDTYARMIVPYLEAHTGAQDIVVQNIVGAGSVRGINALSISKPDGLTIAFASVPTIILADLAGSTGVQFDATRLTYLGRASTEPRVLAVGGKSEIKSIDDVKRLRRPFLFPTQGTDEDFYTMAVLAHSLPFTLKAITGYQGNADTALAVVKGDGDGHITALSDAAPLIKRGDKRPILMVSSRRAEDHPEVPTAVEVTSGEDRKTVEAIVDMIDLHRSFFGPPGMSPEATAALREAVRKALEAPELKAKAAQTGLPIDFMSGQEEQQKVEAIARAGEKIVTILKEAIKAIQ